MKRRTEARSVSLEELLDELPEHLAKAPGHDDEAAYNGWSDALYEYVAAHGYSHLDLIREQVFRLTHPPDGRSER